MTVDASVNPANPSGNVGSDAEAPVGQQDVVSHETYKKVLAEKKSMQAKLAEFEAKQAEQETARLAEQKKFEDLWKAEETKRKKAEELIEGIRQEKVNETKRKAVLAEFGLKREDFLRFVDVDQIPVDSEGMIDSNAVKTMAAEFKVKYPELVVEHKAPPPTGHAPSSVVGAVVIDTKDPKALMNIFKQTRK